MEDNHKEFWEQGHGPSSARGGSCMPINSHWSAETDRCQRDSQGGREGERDIESEGERDVCRCVKTEIIKQLPVSEHTDPNSHEIYTLAKQTGNK